MVDRCCSDDLMPNVPVSCLPPTPNRMDPEVQRLKIIIDCPQPCSSRATYAFSTRQVGGGNGTLVVLLGSGTS